MDESIEKIAVMPMEGAPGTVFRYSNAGLQIAGAILEKISGQSFEQLFIARIATPLGMVNTDFDKGRAVLPAGSGRSTAEDYMHFLMMIRNKGMYNGVRYSAFLMVYYLDNHRKQERERELMQLVNEAMK